MFLDFFYLLRSYKIPVSVTEYLDLLKVIGHLADKGEFPSSKEFYSLARNCMIKDLKHYDTYDQVFAQAFEGIIDSDNGFRESLKKWLEEAKKKELSKEQMKNALQVPPKEMMKELEKRLKDQKKRHDGGNKWIGTGGTSPFGNSGFNPNGIRIGGDGQSQSAMAVVGERKYKEYRTDRLIDTRQIKLALKKLRSLNQSGRPKFSLKKTLKKTCDNGGEIDIQFEKSRKNKLRLLLLMDCGGSMDPHAKNMEQLFSAAYSINHFKEFKYFYFHNIFYDHLYSNSQMSKWESWDFKTLYKHFPKDTKVIIVGDAAMNPYELLEMNQQVRDYYTTFARDDLHGEMSPRAIDRLVELREYFTNIIWLNPLRKDSWEGTRTIRDIKKVVPMFHLGLDGLNDGIRELL